MSYGAISWIDVEWCRLDLDGVPALDGNSGTSALAFDAAYPGANAITDNPSQVARINYTRNSSANLDITVKFTFSASNDKTIRVLKLSNIRLPSDVVQVTAVAKNAAGSVLETATTFTAAQLVLRPGQTDRYDLFWILTADRSGAVVDFNFRFPASTSGYFEIGRAWASAGLVYEKGMGVDWSLSGNDASRVHRGDGGGYAAYRYPVRKVLTLNKRGLSYLQALGDPNSPTALSFREFLLEAGIGAPVVIVSTDENAHQAQVMSCYGTLQNVPSLDHAGAKKFGTGMVVEQIR